MENPGERRKTTEEMGQGRAVSSPPLLQINNIARKALNSDEKHRATTSVHVEEVIHARQVLHVLEDGHQQGGRDGDGAGQQHPSETRPAQPIPPSCTNLHDKLAGVRSSHGGALTSCKDPHGPDVERCRAEETAEHHSLKTDAPTEKSVNPRKSNSV
ncbi:hypothetical protein EYF80_016525 [Liparis tanakae]|uniref:Uncharacterized protein n=1 Tax=Liparis tanakae TaxID=230148 RepID=A0A4Z2I7V0_9TELE|nr:hypothetical protein EYF80_016525 [Liparis tanakae]